MISWIPWLLFLYGLYRFLKWLRMKNLERAFTNAFLRELGQEIRKNPENWPMVKVSK